MFMSECVEPLVPVCYFITLLIFYALTQSMFGVGGAQDTSCVPHCWFFMTKRGLIVVLSLTAKGHSF